MAFQWYVDDLRRRRARAEESRAALEHGCVWSNSGFGMVDMTATWRAELSRRIAELSAIIVAFESGRLI
jgi:hypothetical protein